MERLQSTHTRLAARGKATRLDGACLFGLRSLRRPKPGHLVLRVQPDNHQDAGSHPRRLERGARAALRLAQVDLLERKGQ
eukprot:1325805-Pleurochrysis_carterae.AAC.1